MAIYKIATVQQSMVSEIPYIDDVVNYLANLTKNQNLDAYILHKTKEFDAIKDDWITISHLVPYSGQNDISLLLFYDHDDTLERMASKDFDFYSNLPQLFIFEGVLSFETERKDKILNNQYDWEDITRKLKAISKGDNLTSSKPEKIAAVQQ